MLEETFANSPLNAEHQEAVKQNFFQINQSTLITLTVISAISGAAFAIFYFGVVSVAAAVTFLGKFGLALEALNSMSTLAASGILAGITAGLTSVVATTAYAVGSSFLALSNWFRRQTSVKPPKNIDDESEQEQEEESLNSINKTLKDLSTGSPCPDRDRIEKQENAPLLERSEAVTTQVAVEKPDENILDDDATVERFGITI